MRAAEKDLFFQDDFLENRDVELSPFTVAPALGELLSALKAGGAGGRSS